MVGEIVYRQGNYIEMIVEERGTTRLIVCCDVYATRPQPGRRFDRAGSNTKMKGQTNTR
jgi:hypothetical protein